MVPENIQHFGHLGQVDVERPFSGLYLVLNL